MNDRRPPAVPPAREIVDDVASRKRRPSELLDIALARIAALDPELNCFIDLTAASARAEAERLESRLRDESPPLAGVPIAHKDIISVRGARLTAGSALLESHRGEADADVVRRLRRAGAIAVGKVNTHEFATGVTGTVSHFGPTVNPWSAERVPGGSSCGSAVAVAAGMVAAATATDTGGSIRIPSACCGVVGLKPTYGRVSADGVIPFSHSLDHVGPITRNVEDVEMLLDVISTRQRGLADVPADRRLRFAVPEWFLRRSTPAVERATRAAADALRADGSIEVDFEPPAELDECAEIAITIFLSEGYGLHGPTLEADPDRYCEPTRSFLVRGRDIDGSVRRAALRARRRFADDFDQRMAAIDVLLTPTLPMVAPRITDASIRLPEIGTIDPRAALTLFTRPFNLTGQPALSLPWGRDAEGIPVGVQVVGRRWREADVLEAAKKIEAAAETIGLAR